MATAIRVDHGIQGEAFAAIELRTFAKPWPASYFSHGEDRQGLLISVEDVPAGFLYWSVVLDEAEILRIATLPEFRRRGLASRILEEAERKSPTTRWFLEVEAGNESARCFYKSKGFKETGKRKDYYGKGQDGILMEKER